MCAQVGSDSDETIVSQGHRADDDLTEFNDTSPCEFSSGAQTDKDKLV